MSPLLHRSRALLVSRGLRLDSRRPSRLFSTAIFGGRRPLLSLFLSGLAIGMGLTIPIAGFYHVSGMRNAVDAVQVILSEINQARQQTKNPKSKPSDALIYLRKAAKDYVQLVPLAPYIVDKAFDSVEATIDAHQEEAAVIIERLGHKMSKIIEHHKNMTVPAAWEMLEVVKEETGRLHEVAVRVVKESPVASSASESVQRVAVEGVEKAKELGAGAYAFIWGQIDQRVQRPQTNPETEPKTVDKADQKEPGHLYAAVCTIAFDSTSGPPKRLRSVCIGDTGKHVHPVLLPHTRWRAWALALVGVIARLPRAQGYKPELGPSMERKEKVG
ncbi:hypothetical protein FA13DRAFT_914546 [Coprinellus micaceus]|uniref:Uncharacterized protein n=1 Tax=Coprinellus micaceus TaxID=71717 RepID=A0A4Y7TU65_COPMI|nr:hypothetical protein FA13DRAFT_914546 [Coprinellus micaceus]